MSDKKKKIKVRMCKKCSGFDVKMLKDVLKEKHYTTGCIDKCASKCPELKGKVYDYIKKDFVVCDTSEAFLTRIKEDL